MTAYREGDHFISTHAKVVGNFTPIDWTPDKGYPDQIPENIYPRAGVGRFSDNISKRCLM